MGARAPSIEESYVPSMKGRPSMMVHGDILSARGGGRNASSPGSEVPFLLFNICVLYLLITGDWTKNFENWRTT